MLKLSREIRFALVPPNQIPSASPSNSWAGWPSTNLVVPYLVVECVIKGEPDPTTGYLCNIKIIDDLLREIGTRRVIPIYDRSQTAESLLRLIFREAKSQSEVNADLVSIRLSLSPYLSFAIVQDSPGAPNMSSQTRIQLTQQFEFSAAHRLHCNELSDAENKTMFGKCNNREGHGHNYVIEVTISNEVDSDNGQVFALDRFESIVKRIVIDRLDHKHLNRDIEYFGSTNPSVENIAIAIYQWLDGEFDSAKLEGVKVFETPKTWAECCG